MMEISGRVCPYECQCESHCTRGIKGEPVAIGKLERFVADWHRANIAPVQREVAANGLKAAVVGGGPAGLTCALSLAESGFTVTVYEKEDHTGGVPSWGIPPFVLPRQLLARLSKQLEQQPNAAIRLNTALERDITLDELVHANDAVFLATGAERPVELNLPGRELTQVVQARDYLTHPETYSGKRVLVIGGGNTAIDAARTAVRENADSVTLVYRRNEDAMPATQQECSIAKAEGVQLKTAPLPCPLCRRKRHTHRAGVQYHAVNGAGLPRRPPQQRPHRRDRDAGGRPRCAGTGL